MVDGAGALYLAVAVAAAIATAAAKAAEDPRQNDNENLFTSLLPKMALKAKNAWKTSEKLPEVREITGNPGKFPK